MKIKCDYCQNTYEDTQEQCPYCSAPNGSRNAGDKNPRTIEQLKEWYEARHLPPYETTRFFIGINYQSPRAFGIYKADNGEYIVYKNKENGERAIRYQGDDEEYAVNELYQKLKDEIVHQKHMNEQRRDAKGSKQSTETIEDIEREERLNKKLRKGCLQAFVVLVLPFIIIVTIITQGLYIYMDRHGLLTHGTMGNGYYTYEDTVYYYDSNDYNDDWYYYDNDDESWERTNDDNHDVQAIKDDYDSYYTTDTWDSSRQFADVTTSAAYTELSEYRDFLRQYEREHRSDDNNSWNSSNDSDYNWGSDDSWSSDDTDWDSDW